MISDGARGSRDATILHSLSNVIYKGSGGIARSLERSRLIGYNKSSIKTRFNHRSRDRSFDPLDPVPGDIDLALQPIGILFHQAEHFILNLQFLAHHDTHILKFRHRFPQR